jgi:centrosomal CEP192-like protein
MSSILIGRIVFLSTALATLASAQTIPFQLLATQGNNAAIVQNGSPLTLNSAIGQSQAVQVKATYTGTGQALLPAQPLVIGSTEFTATLATTPPVTLTTGESVSFSIQFLPTSAALSTAEMSLLFIETVPATTAGGTATSTTSYISLSLEGTAPSFVLSYTLQTNGNVVPLQAGGTIVFPSTPVNTTAQAAFNITNAGSGVGTITAISITPGAFSLASVPLFPQGIAAGLTLQVQVLYKPTAVTSDTGQIQVTFATGSPVTINLQGSGSSASLVYQLLQSGTPTTIPPGGTVPIPNTNVGQSSSVVIRVLNTGNASGTVSSINVSGSGYQLSNVPALPQTLAPNASITFTLTFSPTQPGTFNGSLYINSDTLVLAGVGLGPLLTFSYVTGGTTITLGATNTSVVFSPVMISQSAQVILDVKNTGTLAATISNIGIGQTGSPFSLSGQPPLPVTLAPNADFHLTITFTPTALGFANGTLLLDTTTVPLVGSGTQPPPLPSYTIGGASGTVQAGTQPNITLTLASAYPVAVSGVLTAAVSGSLPADPAVLFATGALTVPFIIPADSTSAVFGSQGTQIGLQMGTVAEEITLTPTFATQAGNVDLTPASPTTLQLTVAPAAPTLIAIALSNQTTNGFTISVTGFTTTRTLTAWNVQFTTAAGYTMPVTQFTIDVESIATVWFESTGSRAFGGQFTLSIPFTFQGTVPTGQTVLNSIASVAVTVANGVGTSSSIQINAQ